jgi:hypothetical protein
LTKLIFFSDFKIFVVVLFLRGIGNTEHLLSSTILQYLHILMI